MSPIDTEVSERALVNRVLRGEQEAIADLFALHRERLWRIVNFRLDRRLRGRVDADDVLQEAYLDASSRHHRFLEDASQSCFVWLRLIVNQTLINVHRRHLGAKMRTAERDVSIHSGWDSASTSAALSYQLLGKLTTPSHAAMRAEVAQHIDSSLDELSERDREILALRHFEELSNRETALVLGISDQAASNAYVRALTRLKRLMKDISGSL